MNFKQKKIRAYRLGVNSEILAAWFLRLKGYSIIENRYKSKLGELDIVAVKGRQLAIIEVKSRRNNESMELVSTRQQQRISRAAALFVAKRKEFANFSIRFDVISVKSGFRLQHIKDAWRVNF